MSINILLDNEVVLFEGESRLLGKLLLLPYLIIVYIMITWIARKNIDFDKLMTEERQPFRQSIVFTIVIGSAIVWMPLFTMLFS